MRNAVGGVTGLRPRYQNMALGEKPARDWHFRTPRMTLAEHARIAVKIKPLPSQVACSLRKCAERQIGLAGLQPVFELSRIERHRAHADMRRDRRQARDQRRKEADHSDVGQQQAEPPIRIAPDRIRSRSSEGRPQRREGRGSRSAISSALAVGCMAWPLRTNSGSENCARSCRSILLIEGWVVSITSAVRVMLRSLQQHVENPQLAQAQFRVCLFVHIHHSLSAWLWSSPDATAWVND